ncbi:MAG: hypothetical protein ACUVQM_00280 [Candidatus Hadarchaeaceae archaeon]
MNLPAEIASVVPIAAAFIIGLLVGAIIKKAFNLMVLLIALIIVLVATGVLSLRFHDLFDKAMEILPKLYETGSGWINMLPYSSAAFLLGLAIGLWKG